MKTMAILRKTLALLSVAAIGFMISCTEENVTLQEETALITEDVITDYYFEDADDLAGLAMLADDGTSTGGRIAGDTRPVEVNDHRLKCPGVTITITISPESNSDVPKGEIVIDFGEGCVDAAGNERKGKIIITFVGRRFLPGSYITTQFVNYTINGLKLNGLRKLTNVSNSTTDRPRFKVELNDGKAEWPDGTFATREHCFIREWVRGTNVLLDAMVVGQCPDVDFAAQGINRRGREYRMKIIEPLVYKRGCPIAVKGVKQYIDVASGKVITVDYGDGECDRKVTITVEGNSRTVDVKRG